MGKRIQKSDFDVTKAYRKFVGSKFERYKLKFPRLRQQEVLDKILKEWTALTDEDKQKILNPDFEFYARHSQLSQSSRSQRVFKPNKKIEVEKKDVEKKEKRKRPASPKVKVFIQRPDKQEFNPEIPYQQGELSDSSSEVVIQLAKKEAKVKNRNSRVQLETQKPKSQYSNFFKYYYQRLKFEHPRWSTSELRTIIKLLWRKRSSTQKKKTHVQRQKAKNLRKKPISGRAAYIKSRSELPKQEAIELWKKMTFENKVYWNKIGKNQDPFERKAPIPSAAPRSFMNKGKSEEFQFNPLSFMNKK